MVYCWHVCNFIVFSRLLFLRLKSNVVYINIARYCHVSPPHDYKWQLYLSTNAIILRCALLKCSQTVCSQIVFVLLFMVQLVLYNIHIKVLTTKLFMLITLLYVHAVWINTNLINTEWIGCHMTLGGMITIDMLIVFKWFKWILIMAFLYF